MENVAKLLKLCGESVSFEVLGNKAMNGRVHEISYLGYYLGQVLVSFFTIKDKVNKVCCTIRGS